MPALRPELEFWRLCEEGRRPDPRQFVAQLQVVQPRHVAAILRMDQRFRWHQDDPLPAERYLKDFPAVAADADASFDLIYGEFLLREELGDEPECKDFLERFPDHTQRLRMQIELHQAIDNWEDDEQDTAPADPLTDSRQNFGRGAIQPGPLPKIPGYEIQGILGRGGMGIVYQARQVGLNRLVALKMVVAGKYADAEHLARFKAEAEAAARLHHPHIVQIYDLGEHEGLPYLTLEFVSGGTLAGLLAGGPLEPHRAARMILAMAEAIDFAHQRGIVHRDLKPANVLLSAEGRTNSTGAARSHPTPKIADFGLAKLVLEDLSTKTETGALVGTPSYMAPEQASGQVHRIGPAADIYALGAILYELLTGRPPFKAATLVETLHLVLSAEPASLSRLQPRTPRDLATICLKCLEKEPRRRYASAAELADDLTRFLNDQPIRARRTAGWERAWRFSRRNPVLSTLTLAVAVLLLAVTLVSTYSSMRLRQQLKRTLRAENGQRVATKLAQHEAWESYLAQAQARATSSQMGQRFAGLEAIRSAQSLLGEIGDNPERSMRLRNAAITCLALPDLRMVRARKGLLAEAATVNVPTPHDLLVIVEKSGTVVVRRASDDFELCRFPNELGPCFSPLVSDDGRHVALRTATRTVVWRIEGVEASRVCLLEGVSYPSFSADGNHLAVVDDREAAQLIALETGLSVRTLSEGPLMGACAFHGPTHRIAVPCAEAIEILDERTGQVLYKLPGTLWDYPALAWHPSGQYLAAGAYDEGIIVWDVEQQRRVMALPPGGQAMCLAFDRDGEYLLGHRTWSGHTTIWHVGTGRLVLNVPNFAELEIGHGCEGRLTLHRKYGPDVEVWEFEPARQRSFLPRQWVGDLGHPYHLAVSPDNRLLAAGSDKGLEIWHLPSQTLLASVPLGKCSVHFDTRGDLTVATGIAVTRWPIRSDLESVADAGGRTTVRVGPPEPVLPFGYDDYFLGASGNHSVLAARWSDGWSVVHRSDTTRMVPLPIVDDVRHVDISRDGRWVATAGWEDAGVKVWNAENGTLAADLAVGPLGSVCFSPDGRWLATTPGGVELWHTSNWTAGPKLQAEGTAASGLVVRFSPDSRMLAVVQPGGMTRLVDPDRGADLAVLYDPRTKLANAPTFTPDGTKFLTSSVLEEGGEVQIWDLAALRQELAKLGLDWDRLPLANPESAREMPPICQVDEGDNLRSLRVRTLLRETVALQSAGKTAESLVIARQAVKLDPSSARACNALAWPLLAGPQDLRDPQEGLRWARRAAELEPDNYYYRNTLGLALYRTGNLGEAIAMLEKNLASNQDAAAYDLYVLALCHAAQGNMDQARERFRQARAWHREHEEKLSSSWRIELPHFRDEAERAVKPEE